MNAFTQHVVNEEERRRISSRCPVDVFIPAADNNQYVTDYSGNYWPYRTLNFEAVKNNEASVQRTINRTTKFGIVDTRPPGADFPSSLRNMATDVHADFIYPTPNKTAGRDSITNPLREYENHTFTASTNIAIPIGHPYELTASVLDQLYTSSTPKPSITEAQHPTDFVLRDIQKHANSWNSLENGINTLYDSITNDAKIHLHEPELTSELIQYIRANPGVIDTIVLPNDTPSLITTERPIAETTVADSLSKRGESYLRSGICPYVRAATEFSLLCSSFIDVDTHRELLSLIDESIIPARSPSIEPAERTSEQQGTLTSLLR